MPPVLAAVVPAVIGGAVAINSSNQARRSASEGLAAQTQANDRALEEQRRAREQIFQMQQPWNQGGLTAFDALLTEFGLKPQAGQGGATGQPGAPGAPQSGPNYAGYVDANPDLAAEWQNIQGRDPRFPTKEAYGQWHQQQFGASEPWRQVPQFTPTQQSTGKPEGGNAGVSPLEGAEGQAPNLMEAARPDAGPAPTFERRPDLPVPTFERQPDMAPPPSFSFDPASLRQDQGYQFLLDEMTNNVNARSGARGMLRSGAAAKGLARETAGVADQYLGNVFNRALAGYGANTDAYRYGQNRADNNFAQDRSTGLNLWQTQQGRQDRNDETGYGLRADAYRFGAGRQDQNFNIDRNFQQGRQDTRIGNIFGLAQMGQAAAGAMGGAASNYANNAGSIFGSQANAAALAANQRASANAQMGGALGSIAGNIFAAWPQSNPVGGAAGSAFNPNYRGFGPSGF